MAGAGGKFRLRRKAGAILTILGTFSLVLGLNASPVRAGGSTGIDFVAAGPGTYDHSDGSGGASFGYNDRTISKTEGVVESLEGGDFNCGETVVYLARIPGNVDQVSGGSIDLTFTFDTETTGHKDGTPKVGFGQYGEAYLNTADGAYNSSTAAISSDGGAIVGDLLQVDVTIDNIDAGDVVVLAIEVVLTCEPDVQVKDNTGNLQARLDLTGPGAGDQTITLKSAADIIAPTGTLIIRKTTVNGFGTFRFDVNCDDGATAVEDPQDIDVTTSSGQNPNSTTARTEIEAGTTECTVTEEVEGGGWSQTTPPNGASVVVPIVAGDNYADFTNTFTSPGCPGCTTPTGSLTVSKTVVNGEGDESFDFGVVCGSINRILALGGGDSQTISDIPLGTTCTVVEQEPVDTDEETWTTTVTDSDGAADGVVVVDGAETVSFTNSRTEVAPTVITSPPTTAAPAPAPEPTVLPAVITRELPRTGVDTRDYLVMAGIAILLGGIMLLISDRTRPVELRH